MSLRRDIRAFSLRSRDMRLTHGAIDVRSTTDRTVSVVGHVEDGGPRDVDATRGCSASPITTGFDCPSSSELTAEQWMAAAVPL